MDVMKKVGPNDKEQGSQMEHQLIWVPIDVVSSNNKNQEYTKCWGFKF